MRHFRSTAHVLVASVLAMSAAYVPASAHAERYVVWAGASTAAPAGTPTGAAVSQFMPARLQVHINDTISFKTRGRATVTFLGSRTVDSFPAFTPVFGETYTGLTDAAGAPFHFEGNQKFHHNSEIYRRRGNVFLNLPGTMHNSGLLRGRGITYKATQAGTFPYVNLLSPAMRGTIQVLPYPAAIRTPAEVDAAAVQTQRVALQTTKSLAATKPPVNTVYVGMGRSGASLNAFLPSELTVPAGTKVRFLSYDPYTIHSLVFGDPTWAASFLSRTTSTPGPNGVPSAVSPVFVYGSDPGATASAPFDYTSSLHGNGFWASKLMDSSSTTPMFPGVVELTFPEPGTYDYFCGVHGQSMHGTITVTE